MTTSLLPSFEYPAGAAPNQCTVEVQTGSTLTDLYQSFVAADPTHAGYTIFALCGVAFIVTVLISVLAKRLFRTIMVVIRGWPPAHLDADGDAVELDEDE